jgi:hypothetical protein
VLVGIVLVGIVLVGIVARRSARIRRANPTREEIIRRNMHENPEWGTVDWRDMYRRQNETIRRIINMIKDRIRSIITDPKFNYLIIPAQVVTLQNQLQIIVGDSITYEDTPFGRVLKWIAKLKSLYINDLPIYPTEDEVVNYVTKRILEGTDKLNNVQLPNNGIVYDIGWVTHIIE